MSRAGTTYIYHAWLWSTHLSGGVRVGKREIQRADQRCRQGYSSLYSRLALCRSPCPAAIMIMIGACCCPSFPWFAGFFPFRFRILLSVSHLGIPRCCHLLPPASTHRLSPASAAARMSLHATLELCESLWPDLYGIYMQRTTSSAASLRSEGT